MIIRDQRAYMALGKIQSLIPGECFMLEKSDGLYIRTGIEVGPDIGVVDLEDGDLSYLKPGTKVIPVDAFAVIEKDRYCPTG